MSTAAGRTKTVSGGFVERSLERFVRAMGRALESEQVAKEDGLLQRLDPRVKLVGLPALIVAAVVSRRLVVIAGVFVVALMLAALSRVPLRTLASRIWIAVLAFTGLIALPAIFITPGEVVYRLAGLHVTAQGIRAALYLISRTETAATLSLLLVLCTPWAHLLKAMRTVRLPVVIVVVFGMTYRYILLLLETAREMFESRRSRTVGTLSGSERRKVASATAGVLMGKSLQLSNDVYVAMQSRGYTGEVELLSEFRMTGLDYAGLVVLLGVSAAAVWLGR